MVTISDFRFAAANPSPVPLPPAFLLSGAALAGLGFVRRRKVSAAVRTLDSGAGSMSLYIMLIFLLKIDNAPKWGFRRLLR
jgi:hypothetical protein